MFKQAITAAVISVALSLCVSAAPASMPSFVGVPSALSGPPGANYYSWSLPNGSQAHLLTVDLSSGKWEIRPALSEPRTARTSDLASKFNATAAINGGYFNLKDGVSASYVFIDGKMVADPTKNQQLINNPKLTLFLPEIFERTFLRVLAASAGKCSVDIGIKDEKLPVGYAIVHALQGGPRLLPTLEAEGEAFLRTNPDGTVSDSIGVNKEAARTAFGVMADGRAMLLCVAGKGQDQESSGITLAALADLMKRLGCTEAVNLDGGSSTTMVAKLAGSPGKPKLVCGKQPETLVKSILLVRPKLRP